MTRNNGGNILLLIAACALTSASTADAFRFRNSFPSRRSVRDAVAVAVADGSAPPSSSSSSASSAAAAARSYFFPSQSVPEVVAAADPSSPPSSSSSYFPGSYFRKLVGFRPVYADAAGAVEEGDDVGLPQHQRTAAAAKSSDAESARWLGLFNPFNPLNPFANLVTLPTTTNGLNVLQLKGKQAVVARANLVANDGVTAVGTINFYQENALKPIVAVAAGIGNTANTANIANGRIEVTTNAAGTAAGACAAATLGVVFNPTGVTDGGVLSTTFSSNAAQRFSTFINSVPVTRATLYSPNSIIGRGIRFLAVGAAAADISCGTIQFVA